MKNIRNFCIVAHIDHGKSTLADRLIEECGAVLREKHKDQMLDSMDLEQERGITIKLKAIRMFYKYGDKDFQLNLIDTPGHVDFGYEVSRSLAACEGALLLVDASQGIEAQTLVNYEKARAQNLKIIPVINKIDLPSARPEEIALQLTDLGFDENEICYTSAKTGEGVKDLLKKIVEIIPGPDKGLTEETRALVFDSFYDDYRGVMAFVRVINGEIKNTDTISLLGTRAESRVIELGYLKPSEVKIDKLLPGEVGYIATGFKDINHVRVGDTLTLSGQNPDAISGYKVPLPVVFLSFYPEDSSKYLDLRESLEKLRLSDYAFSFEPESIGSIGKGFRCGFLGLLHADIISERIEREFGVSIIATSPSVKYEVTSTSGDIKEIKSAAEFPDPTHINEVREPWAKVVIFSKPEYMSPVMELCKERRGVYTSMDYMDTTRIRIEYELPLAELIIDFYDKLKSVTSGYASLDYEILDYRKADVIRLNILVAGNTIPALAQLVLREKAQEEGKRVVSKLKDLIPRQQFKVAIQAAISEKVIARETISPVRKDVTGHLYGGDVTRKKKLLEQQKKGKKRLKRFGSVDIPQDVFWKVMEK